MSPSPPPHSSPFPSAKGVPQLLPLRQAASLLSRSARTVRRLIAAGELPAYRIRGRLYVKRDELRAFIERHVEIPPS